MGDESGQSLPIVLFILTVIIAVSAFAVDAGAWMEHHHQAQVSADSAALAAANCLANPGTTNLTVNGQSVANCSSSTDTSDAQNVAIAYAGANGVSLSGSNVAFDTTKGTVTVTATVTSGGAFAGFFGLGATTQTARAIASYKPSVKSSCGSAGSNCDFMFAKSSNCASGTYALNVSLQGNAAINGNIQTNGNLQVSETGNAGGVQGSGNYGSGYGCTNTDGGNHDPWKKGDPTAAATPINWPVDYSTDFPTVSSGYPPACTKTGTNFAFSATNMPVADNVYCAIGTGSSTTPSSWNGTITFNMSSNNTIIDSFVAGTISYTGSGNDTITACGFTLSGYSSATCNAPKPTTPEYPVFYAIQGDPTGSSALSIPSSQGSLALSGDIFVPAGTANIAVGGNQGTYTLIEANAIVASLSGNFFGDGPQFSSGTGGNITGSDALIQ